MKTMPDPDPLPQLTLPQNSAPEPDPVASEILEYLKHELPEYRFDPHLDILFVRELLADFPDTDVLEEIKTFRWYHDNEPLSGIKTQRVAIRRWVARAARSRYR